MMKKVWALLISVVVLVASAVYVGYTHYPRPVKPDCGVCLQWVKDTNTSNFYFGWYEQDGSAFNCIEMRQNVRFGAVAEKPPVPVYFWKRIQ